jgi:hypothetical protein
MEPDWMAAELKVHQESGTEELPVHGVYHRGSFHRVNWFRGHHTQTCFRNDHRLEVHIHRGHCPFVEYYLSLRERFSARQVRPKAN